MEARLRMVRFIWIAVTSSKMNGPLKLFEYAAATAMTTTSAAGTVHAELLGSEG